MPDLETKFINSLFLKNFLETQYNVTNAVVKKFSIESASGGSNTTRSSMSRILMKYSSQESKDNDLSVVAKIKPVTGELKDEFKKCDLFDKETITYKKILPAMVDILKKAGGKIEIGPDLIYYSEVPSDVLIFEDLTRRGYNAESPQLGLNLDQSLLAVEKLAFFHAASVIMLQKNKADFAKFTKGTFHEVNKTGLKYFSDAFRTFIDNGGKGVDIDSKTLHKMKSLSPKIIEKGIEDYTSSIKGFQVLNHGDFWTGNLLYRYEGTELADVLFLDYQNAVVGSPIIDLIYFLTTSVSYETLVASRDEIVYTYYETLSILLNKLEYRGYLPTLTELQIELLKRGALEIIYTVTAAPYLRNENSKIAPVIQPALYKEDLSFDKNHDFVSIFSGQKQGLKSQIARFESLGLLEWGARPSKIRGLMGNFQY
jgi:hypothetical protein